MNILMINLPFSGHTNPTLPLTAELVKRGHHVTYINAEPFRKSIEESGAHFVPYADFPANPTEQDKKKLSFIAAFRTAMNMKEQFDLLIYEMFFYPGIEISKRKGIPCVRQFSQPAWSEKTWDVAPFIFRTSAKLIDMQVLPKRTAQALGLEYTCLRDGIIKSKPDLNIVYVPEAFQLRRKSFGEDYIFRVPEAKAVKGEITIPYEEMKAPVVYISLGSIISDKGFCKKSIKAFGNKGFSVILNTGRVSPKSLGNIPKNIYAYSFVPQIEVLTHTDVFLTHCGMNSINEALTLGVPMVAMPFMNDQLTNAKRIVQLGIGRQIRSIPSSSNEMYEAVKTVYTEKSFKQNAVEVQNIIRRQISWDCVIGRIEQLVENRHEELI